MPAKVAVARVDEKGSSFREALKQLGGINDLNSAKRSVLIKVGVFDHETQNHTTVDVVKAIVDSFDKAPRIYIAESDNCMGTGIERLRIWKKLFTKRVVPFNLSEDADIRRVKVADEQLGLSHVLFKPNVFVSTHILRTYQNGSVLKNLLGLIPDKRKARFHRKLQPALLDTYEAIGGIDLAVLDGTYLRHGIRSNPHARLQGDKHRTATNIVLVGRDAVAVETVGLFLAGLNPAKVPIIHEAVRRKLGEGSLSKIEVIGASIEKLKEEVTVALKAWKKMKTKGPQTWGGRAYNVYAKLIEEGFFKLPNKRAVADVAKMLEAKGLKATGKEDKIMNALDRRVKKGILESSGDRKTRLYWTE